MNQKPTNITYEEYIRNLSFQKKKKRTITIIILLSIIVTIVTISFVLFYKQQLNYNEIPGGFTVVSRDDVWLSYVTKMGGNYTTHGSSWEVVWVDYDSDISYHRQVIYYTNSNYNLWFNSNIEKTDKTALPGCPIDKEAGMNREHHVDENGNNHVCKPVTVELCYIDKDNSLTTLWQLEGYEWVLKKQ